MSALNAYTIWINIRSKFNRNKYWFLKKNVINLQSFSGHAFEMIAQRRQRYFTMYQEDVDIHIHIGRSLITAWVN